MKDNNADLEVTIMTIDQDLAERDYKEFLKFVSKEKQERIGRFHFYKDAQTALLADVLVRYEICKRTGLSNWQLRFSSDEYGKPYLVNDPHTQYNISHSGNYVAFAIDSKPVGIDIEEIKPIDLKIADRFFTKEEASFITSQFADVRIQTFFQIWTLKESRIKFEDKGFSMSLSSFNVLEEPSENTSIWYHNIPLDRNDMICHVCTKQQERPTHSVISLKSFLHTIV